MEKVIIKLQSSKIYEEGIRAEGDFGVLVGFVPIVVPFQWLLHSVCCYRMADLPSPLVVVVEVVGWDGIDPLPELPLFHATAEDSFGGSLYLFGEPAIFWLEGWRAFMRFHRGDEEAPTQEAPVLAGFRSFLVRYYGEDWEAIILSESGEVLLFELRAILAGWLGLVGSRERSSLRRWTRGP